MKIPRRNLPHITAEHSLYFITFRIREGSLSYEEQMLALNHIKSGHKIFYILIAVVIMKDHIHILLKPSGYTLSRIMKGIKGVTAREINKLRGTSGAFWQDESYDRIIRDEKELENKVTYMLYNPVKKGYIEDPYLYHGWHFNENYIQDLF